MEVGKYIPKEHAEGFASILTAKNINDIARASNINIETIRRVAIHGNQKVTNENLPAIKEAYRVVKISANEQVKTLTESLQKLAS